MSLQSMGIGDINHCTCAHSKFADGKKDGDLLFVACPSLTNYSKDLSLAPVLYKGTITQTIGSQFAESVPFLKPIEVISVTSKGAEYSCEEFGVSVKIPEGAIPFWLHSCLEVGIAPHGPFEFPAGMMPISPILWVCMPHESLLLKPVEIRLPHCLTDLSEADPLKQDIRFLKANHDLDYSMNSNGRRVFRFKEADGHISFPDCASGVLQTKRFCFKCLGIEKSPESTRKRGYCLLYTIPKQWPNLSIVNISIGITYFLQACIEVSCSTSYS